MGFGAKPHIYREIKIYIFTSLIVTGRENMLDYPWSAYLSLISIKPTKLMRDKVFGWFDSRANFIAYHKEKQPVDLIKYSLLEE